MKALESSATAKHTSAMFVEVLLHLSMNLSIYFLQNKKLEIVGVRIE